ncbi:MAG: trypsin-like peptidase domain-containing protein [Spirochaetota bacterium]
MRHPSGIWPSCECPPVSTGRASRRGTGSRVTITYTRGVVSGFEETSVGTIIKSDAEINEGNSGGAALNDEFELVGLPTQVVGFDAGQLAYIYPVGLIPEEWLRTIAAAR